MSVIELVYAREVLDKYKLDFVKACELYADSITEAFNKLEVKNE